MNNERTERRATKLRYEIVVAYTLDETTHRIERRDIDVGGTLVIVDNLTNDVRGTRGRKAASPDELVFRVKRLRERILAAAARSVLFAK